MDFIIRLLKSKNPTIKFLYEFIIIMINKLTKYIHFILFKEIFDAKQLRHFLLIELYNIKMYYKASLITKDIFFISAYWITLMKKIDTKLKLSITYYS